MPSTLPLFGIFLLIGAGPMAIKSARRIAAYRQMQALHSLRDCNESNIAGIGNR